MKYYELAECVKFLQDFKSVASISRVEDNTLKINFNPKTTIYASLQRGSSGFFMSDAFQTRKRYRAPFDIMLAKRFSNADIESLGISPNDRVVFIKASQKNSYKMTKSTLVLEFTGKNTNAVILDEEDKIAEALRHIDKDLSYRVVKIGEKLSGLPPYIFKEKQEPIADTKAFLYEEYQKKQETALQNAKNSKLSLLQKKIDRAHFLLSSLESEETIEKTACQMSKNGSLLLSHRYLAKGYEEVLEIEDFEGKTRKITIGKLGIQAAINEFFSKSKKLKQKAKSIYIERENLKEKIEFLENMSGFISRSKTAEETEILLPKAKNAGKKEEQNGSTLTFFMENYKIIVGKNEKGNIELLKNAKKNDIWFHIKDIPSPHVILKTDKQKAPLNVLEFCAKVCLNFSGVSTGTYDVDYTQRQNVKIINGANVAYTDFNTIRAQK